MIDLLMHLCHNDHGELSMLASVLADAFPALRTWLAARVHR